MAEGWAVHSVRDLPRDGWAIVLRKADGELHEVHMPSSILAYRAAEYGIPEDDTDTLLHVVLHEFPLTWIGAENSGVTLFQARSTAVARTEHMARLGLSPITVNVKGSAALDHIRHAHHPNPDRHRALREHVDVTRWEHLYGPLPLPARPAGIPLLKGA